MRISIPPADLAKHQRNVELLVAETNQPQVEVQTAYDNVLHHLQDIAAFPDYLPILAWRHTREHLLHR